MSDHDALCPQRHQYRGHKSRCICALLTEARADERAALNGKLLTLYMQNTHAEAVAAKLVEVICQDAAEEALLNLALRYSRNQRDAARARTVEAEQKVIDAHREVALARAEVAALQVLAQDANEAFASGRREVLADLRAKVEGLPVLVTDMHNGTGPHYYEHTVLLADVLALIEEAGQ